MSTADQILDSIKTSKSKHYTTNDNAGGFRVDVRKMFKESPKLQNEVRRFNKKFTPLLKRK